MGKEKKIRVAYFCHDANSYAGAGQSLFNLVRSVDKYVTPIIIASTGGVTYDKFVAAGYECHIIPFYLNNMVAKVSLNKILLYPFRLIRFIISESRNCNKICELLKDRNVDIIHSNTSAYTIGYKVAKKMGVKHVWHLREMMGLINRQPIYPLGRKAQQKMIYDSDFVIAITKTVFSYYNLDKIDYKATFIWDAVRSQNDKCFNHFKEKYLLHCANDIDPIKNPDKAIEGFVDSGLAEEGWSLIMIGNDKNPYATSLKKNLNANKMDKGVVFIGQTDNVKDYLSKAAGLLMTTEFEGLGRVTIEAMFYGCPVIAFNSAGSAEILKDEQTGYLFNRFEKLPNLIRKVASSDNADIIVRAQQYAIDNFSEEKYGVKIYEIYKSIL